MQAQLVRMPDHALIFLHGTLPRQRGNVMRFERRTILIHEVYIMAFEISNGDFIILTAQAPEIAVCEEHGAGAAHAYKLRLFAEMRAYAGNANLGCRAADPDLALQAIDMAMARAERAVIQNRFEMLCPMLPAFRTHAKRGRRDETFCFSLVHRFFNLALAS